MVALLIRLSILFASISGLILILPNSPGLPPDVATSFNYIVNLARGFDWLFPINTLFTILIAVVVFEIAIFFFKTVRWLLHLLNTSSAGS